MPSPSRTGTPTYVPTPWALTASAAPGVAATSATTGPIVPSSIRAHSVPSRGIRVSGAKPPNGAVSPSSAAKRNASDSASVR